MLLAPVLAGLFCGLPGPSPAHARQAAIVSGRAVDAADGSPLALATVVVVNAESGDTLSGTLAGADGRFQLRGLAPGRYAIHTSFPGYQAWQSDVLVSELNPTYDLGDIRLVTVVGLEAIEVTANAL
jgi:hypothetical protein